ncbi:hypothetical protein BaRGS_00012037 [Batillaria attramentaria]|uniref:Uncharacterized protein n=1 Tax=Batillaria attramentaria TaxID=370345 RepID=A0ABD0LBJ4_9CAEN
MTECSRARGGKSERRKKGDEFGRAHRTNQMSFQCTEEDNLTMQYGQCGDQDTMSVATSDPRNVKNGSIRNSGTSVTRISWAEMNAMTSSPSSFRTGRLLLLCRWIKRIITCSPWHRQCKDSQTLAPANLSATTASETTYVFRYIPDYSWLAALACMFSPPLGIAVFCLNARAVMCLKEGRLNQANRLYFLTIVVGVVSIVLTLVVCAEIGLMIYFDRQYGPCGISPENSKAVAFFDGLNQTEIFRYQTVTLKNRPATYLQELALRQSKK